MMKSIRQIIYLTCSVLLLVATCAPLRAIANADAANLIVNPSVETTDPVNPSLPQGWSQGGWGTNSRSFSYLNSGHTGIHSLNVKISSYSSGDAKWFFNPVAVQASTSYQYSDYYQSTISSEIVAQFDDGSGNYTYQDLGSAPAASGWQQFQVNFTTAATTKQITIFHLISAVGSLTIDDASLTLPTATDPNLVSNASFEQFSQNQPTDWYQGQWGDNLSNFSYLNSGHTGSHSVRIDMSSYSDGGANWTYSPVHVKPGQVYMFSDYYQSSVTTQVLVAVQMSNGSTQYLWLGNPYASDASWTRFFATFTMPAGAVSAVAYQQLSANGYLTEDDYSFEPYMPQGFKAPIVSVTFDDSIANQYKNGLPVLKTDGIKATFYVISGYVGVCDPNVSSICYMTQAQVAALASGGQEVASHTVDHPDLTTLPVDQIDNELSQSQATLSQWIKGPVTDLAAPYGDINLSVLTVAKKYYVTQRGTQAGYNDKNNFNPFNLYVQNVDSDTTVAQVKSYINYAKATNTWLILVYHDINSDATADPGYDTLPTNFRSEMSYLKQSAIPTLTIEQAMGVVGPQVGQ